eukprot:8460025-Alexandrium_andersonii.AAC.1
MAKPSLMEVFVRGPLWPSSGQRGSDCAASAWCTCGGAELHVQRGPAARARVWRPERRFPRLEPWGLADQSRAQT